MIVVALYVYKQLLRNISKNKNVKICCVENFTSILSLNVFDVDIE